MRETPKAYYAKILYLEMHPSERSLMKLCKLMGKNPESYLRQLEEWSSQHKWQAACKIHDEAMIKEEMAMHRQELQKNLDKMNQDQIVTARNLHIKSTAHLSKLLEDGSLWGRDAVALWKNTFDAWRMAQGAAIERTEVNSTVDGTLTIEAVWGTGIIDSDTQQPANNLIDFPIKEIS